MRASTRLTGGLIGSGLTFMSVTPAWAAGAIEGATVTQPTN